MYGIKNCDTVKKARKWLQQRGIAYRFHDLRADGLNEKQLRKWVSTLGWEALLNKRSSTWRKLSAAAKQDLNQERAIALMVSHPTVIKRPLLQAGSSYLLGFAGANYARFFA